MHAPDSNPPSVEWTTCPAIERVPGKLSGVPVVKQSRVRPEDLVANRAQGEAWLSYAYDLPVEIVREVLAFYELNKHRLALAV